MCRKGFRRAPVASFDRQRLPSKSANGSKSAREERQWRTSPNYLISLLILRSTPRTPPAIERRDTQHTHTTHTHNTHTQHTPCGLWTVGVAAALAIRVGAVQ